MKNRPPLLPAAAIALLLASPLAAAGPNLLTTPTFDTTVGAGWYGQENFWSGKDAHGSARSGSLLKSLPPASGTVVAAYDCVAAAPGQYLVHALVNVDGPEDSGARAQVEFYASNDCSGPVTALAITPQAAAGGWRQIAGSGTAPATTHSAVFGVVTVRSSSTGTTNSYWDDLYLGLGACPDGPTTLCLNGERFKVRAHYDSGSQQGFGTAVPFADESGRFWFFSPSNVELDVKVLDGCGVNNRYWFFAAGLTNVAVELTVTDTDTGVTNTYRNAAGHVFSTITDTGAFATCP